jgi:hypothetical protein
VTEPLTGSTGYLAEGLRWAILSVPILLVGLMALVRSLVHKGKFFCVPNLCLGIDLCFAAIAASLVEGFEVAQQLAQKPDDKLVSRTIIAFCMVFINFWVLLCVTKLHHDCNEEPDVIEGHSATKRARLQQYENKRHNRRRIWLLLVASNLLGSTSIVGFAFLFAREIV